MNKVNNINKSIAKLEGIGFVIVSIAGTLLHFVYDRSGKNKIVGLFAPVNESPFEHLKLLFFPFIIYAVFEVIKLSDSKFNVSFAKLIGILCGTGATLSVFYICEGALGKSIDAVNIASFFIGIGVAFLVSYHIIKSSKGRGFINGMSAALLIVISIVFIYFTLYPIEIPLFKDPTNMSYGISG